MSVQWHRVLAADELPEGRVTTVAAGHKSVALVHYDGQFSALDNHCPHQGGPLGEGSIENGLLRCPWHGYDYCPLDGSSPGFDDEATTYPLEIRDGEVYVGVAGRRRTSTTVTDLMAETMVNWGVEHVFGMVGHSNLGLADALRRQEEAGRLTYIGIRHEGAAAFAASAYGKLTGRPAACLTIAGPGATNLLTGLWDAKVDRAPVLALTGQVDTQVLGPGAFQEVDLAGAFGSVAAWSQPVLRDSNPVELMNLACKNALLRRDVAHLIFPDEVQTLPAPEGAEAGGPAGRVSPSTISPPEESIEDALRLLRGCEAAGDDRRPRRALPHARGDRARRAARRAGDHDVQGQGPDRRRPPARRRRDRAQRDAGGELGDERGRPAARARRVVLQPHRHLPRPPDHPGRLRPDAAREVPPRRGARVGRDRRRGRPAARASCPSGSRPTTRPRSSPSAGRSGGRRRPAAPPTTAATGVNSASVFAAMERQIPDDAVIAVDVGNHAYSFGRYFECKRHTVLMSGYLGSIGFGYPAAMGAWAAAPDRPIVAVTGDGGFAQYMAELTTAVKHGMNITHVLLNNGQLGKISKEQAAGEWEVWQTSLHNPDFSAFARNCGALGIRVTDRAELDAALAEAVAHDGPAMVEVITDPNLV